jgi:hypothetical protein
MKYMYFLTKTVLIHEKRVEWVTQRFNQTCWADLSSLLKGKYLKNFIRWLNVSKITWMGTEITNPSFFWSWHFRDIYLLDQSDDLEYYSAGLWWFTWATGSVEITVFVYILNCCFGNGRVKCQYWQEETSSGYGISNRSALLSDCGASDDLVCGRDLALATRRSPGKTSTWPLILLILRNLPKTLHVLCRSIPFWNILWSLMYILVK